MLMEERSITKSTMVCPRDWLTVLGLTETLSVGSSWCQSIPSQSRWWWNNLRGQVDTRWARTDLGLSGHSADSRWSEAWWEFFQWRSSGAESAAGPHPPLWWSLWCQRTEGLSTWGFDTITQITCNQGETGETGESRKNKERPDATRINQMRPGEIWRYQVRKWDQVRVGVMQFWSLGLEGW